MLGILLLAICASGVLAADPTVSITVTKWAIPPLAPTNFRITETSSSSINITWAKGTAANITIVRMSTEGYPFSIYDGNSTYSGNGTYVEVGGLDLENSIYYFRAWSQNEYGTSLNYAQASVGQLGISIADLYAYYIYLTDALEGPMGIANMFLVLGLLGFALWKKGWIRILLAVCIIVWGVFAMEYDIKVAAPLLAIGTVLFFMGILNEIRRSRESGQGET